MAYKDVLAREQARKRAAQVNMGSTGPTGASSSDQRFRSFAERYLIERASMFRTDKIDEDIWKCILDAKRIYKQIEAVGRSITEEL